MALLWLSLRGRWRRTWARSLVVALLIGGVGGFILAAAASARRVQNTYQSLADEIDAPDAVVVPGCEPLTSGFGCAEPSDPGTSEDVVAQLQSLAAVEQVRSIEAVVPYLTDTNGAPLLATADDEAGCFDDDRSVYMIGLVPGGSAEQAMPFRLDGELPSQGSAGVVLALATAEREGIGVGDEVRLAGWCTVDGDPAVLPEPMRLTVTGLSVGPLDIEPPDTGAAIEPAYVDPVVVEHLVARGSERQVYQSVWLHAFVPPGTVSEALASYEVVFDLRDRAAVFDDALSTDARLLWLIGAVGAAGAVLLLVPIVSRNVRDTTRDTAIVVALGSSRRQIAAQALAHLAVLAVIGAIVAALVSPLIAAFMPRGFAESIAPHRAVWFDWPVVVVGGVVLVAALIAMGVVPAWRIGRANQAVSRRLTHRGAAVARWRLRPPASSGVLTAVGAPAGPRQPSPWPSFVSLVIAGGTCVAGVTYLGGLDHLERTPSLMGWNWNARVVFDGTVPELVPTILSELDRIDGIDMVTAGTPYPPAFLTVPESGQVVFPWSFGTGPQAIKPTMLTGRAPDGPDEVAINTVLADANGLAVGDSVSFTRPALVSLLAGEFEQWALEFGLADSAVQASDEPPVTASYEITGLALLPLTRTEEWAQATFTLGGLAALAEPDDDELAAARAWLPDNLSRELMVQVDEYLAHPDIDDRGVYLRTSGDLQAVARAVDDLEGVEQVIAPDAEQVLTLVVGLNLGHQHRVPTAMVYAACIAAAALLAYLLFTTVRARRFELAVMRALGLASRGVRWSVVVQATATAVIPFLVAVPLGVVVGRRAWLAQARDLDVMPQAVTPWPTIAVVVIVAIVFANIVAAVPAWVAVRRSPDDDLRAG